jgi:hypothetical protein
MASIYTIDVDILSINYKVRPNHGAADGRERQAAAVAQQPPHHASLPREARELPRHAALIAALRCLPRTRRSRGGRCRGDPRLPRAIGRRRPPCAAGHLLFSCIFRRPFRPPPTAYESFGSAQLILAARPSKAAMDRLPLELGRARRPLAPLAGGALAAIDRRWCALAALVPAALDVHNMC